MGRPAAGNAGSLHRDGDVRACAGELLEVVEDEECPRSFERVRHEFHERCARRLPYAHGAGDRGGYERSERCERTFAHVCENGGGRRTWWRELVNVTKALVLKCAAFNLGLLLRKLFGLTKPRNAQGGAAALCGPAR